MSEEARAALNTDREIWRGKSRAEFGDPDRFYADSIFVTEGEGIGMNCGGHVIVKPIREWFALAQANQPQPIALVGPDVTIANGVNQPQEKAQPDSAEMGQFEPLLTDLSHTRSCPELKTGSGFCTCGLVWRIRLRTEMEMHNAWRKRAEQAETERDAAFQRGQQAMAEKAAQLVAKWRKHGECNEQCAPNHLLEAADELERSLAIAVPPQSVRYCGHEAPIGKPCPVCYPMGEAEKEGRT